MNANVWAFSFLAIASINGVGAEASAKSANPPAFDQLDVHHQGYLTRSQLPASLANLKRHFNEYDYNHDGRLTQPEYRQFLLVDQKNAANTSTVGTGAGSSAPPAAPDRLAPPGGS